MGCRKVDTFFTTITFLQKIKSRPLSFLTKLYFKATFLKVANFCGFCQKEKSCHFFCNFLKKVATFSATFSKKWPLFLQLLCLGIPVKNATFLPLFWKSCRKSGHFLEKVAKRVATFILGEKVQVANFSEVANFLILQEIYFCKKESWRLF